MTTIPPEKRVAGLMTSRTAVITTAAVAVGGAALLIGLVFFSGMMVHWDCALQLQSARMLLRGNVPYVGYVELNPPMAHYVHVIPVLIARFLGTAVPITFQACVLALVLWSAGALLLITRRSRAIRTLAGRYLVAAAWITFSVLVFADGGFGQREHLFALAFGPWFYAREARHRGVALSTWLALPIGLFGGMFILLKPHFLFVVLVVEGWLLYRSRRWTALGMPEVYLFASIGVAYGLSLVAITPLRQAFFGRWVPFIAKNYEVYNSSFRSVLLYPWFGDLFWKTAAAAFLLALVAAWVDSDSKKRTQLGALAISIVAGFAMYLIQHKGWTYHIYPAVGFLSLLLAASCVSLLEAQPPALQETGTPSGVKGAWRALLLAGCLLNLAIVGIHERKTALREAGRLHARFDKYVSYIRDHSDQEDRIGFIDTRVSPNYPSVVLANRLPAGRYLQAFPIAFFYNGKQRTDEGNGFPYRSAGELTSREQRFLAELGKDILTYQPKLVFIEHRFNCRACPTGFNVKTYLKHAGWTEKYLKNYVPETSVGIHAVYRRRKPGEQE